MIVSFHPLAERELNDAAQYYEMESRDLGSAFLAEIEAFELRLDDGAFRRLTVSVL